MSSTTLGARTAILMATLAALAGCLEGPLASGSVAATFAPASDLVDEADARARAWRADARLVRVGADASETGPLGTSERWAFTYVSDSAANLAHISVTANGRIAKFDAPRLPSDPQLIDVVDPHLGLATLPPGALASARISEAVAANETARRMVASATTALHHSLHTGDDGTVWLIAFQGPRDRVEIAVDAFAGTVVGIRDFEAMFGAHMLDSPPTGPPIVFDFGASRPVRVVEEDVTVPANGSYRLEIGIDTGYSLDASARPVNASAEPLRVFILAANGTEVTNEHGDLGRGATWASARTTKTSEGAEAWTLVVENSGGADILVRLRAEVRAPA